ncbi:MAG: endonuclease III domain-containing protein [Deltaproteobacteria bacterium]|nr:endonuclease III domain-containing protein [Deltaproteobacteria bacterium]
MANALSDIFDRLYRVFGPRHWWPGETAFEVMVGAVLTQNTAWINVEKAINNLKEAGCLNPEALHRMSEKKLAGLIRPSGYYNLKAGRLKNMVSLVMDGGGGDPPLLLERPRERLRRELLDVKGIGPETADSILLYAAGYPVFVIDAYTRRILERHGLSHGHEPYGELQDMFMNNMPADPQQFNEFHALLVHLGKHFCKPKPHCSGCPLEDLKRSI